MKDKITPKQILQKLTDFIVSLQLQLKEFKDESCIISLIQQLMYISDELCPIIIDKFRIKLIKPVKANVISAYNTLMKEIHKFFISLQQWVISHNMEAYSMLINGIILLLSKELGLQ